LRCSTPPGRRWARSSARTSIVSSELPSETVMKDGRLVKRQGKVLRAEDCRVFIREHQEGYIDWET